MEPKTVGRLHQRPALALQAKISGFVVGTDIVTGDGLLPVEHVGAGDRIVTRDAGMQRVAWAEAAYVTTHAVKISPDALGRGRPEDAVIVPAGQKLLVRDWRARALYGAAIAYVPAYRLADG
ncbi:MAG: Hint domain-containing protein, partial [Pseudomonadota bacterium]